LPRTWSILKAAVAAGSTGFWQDAYDAIVTGGAFVDAIRSESLFDTIEQYSQHAEFRVATGFSPTAVTASQVTEGAPIPVTPLTFTKKTVNPIKVAGIVVATNEILQVSRGNKWLFTELGRALVRG